MRRFLSIGFLGAAAALVLGAAPVAAQQGQFKIGVVNTQRVLAELPSVGAAQRSLESELGRYRTEVDTLERSLQRRQEALQANTTLTAAARTQQQQALQQSVAAYQQRVAQLNQLAEQRQQAVVAPVMRQVTEAIERIRREQGFSMIWDAAAQFVVAVDPAFDITDRVIAAVRALPAPAATPAPAAPAPRP
jgi:outer membrane protein